MTRSNFDFCPKLNGKISRTEICFVCRRWSLSSIVWSAFRRRGFNPGFRWHSIHTYWQQIFTLKHHLVICLFLQVSKQLKNRLSWSQTSLVSNKCLFKREETAVSLFRYSPLFRMFLSGENSVLKLARHSLRQYMKSQPESR